LGTTGDPRGAPHGAPPPLAGLSVLVSLLTAVPLRGGTTVVLPTPAFHAWGYLNLTLVALLGSTAVLPHRFDPADTLRQVEEHRASGLVVVPAMLHRLLKVPAGRHDTSSLGIVVVSGAAFPVELALRAERRFGPVLYDLYGSTEAGYVSVASPADRRAAPGTVGRPLPGVQLRLLDADGREVPRGQPGRVFVRGALTFAGYQDGGDAQQVDGLVATGDAGRLDADGRLFVEGRTDEMVVTGGENVFPAVVEAALAEHPAVAEVAVAGVPDETYGARLVAYVAVVVNLTVTRPTSPGFLTVYPGGQPLPATSNLNFVAGETRANRVIVPVGTDGTVAIYNRSGSSHVIVDVNGWYTAGGAVAGGSEFAGLTPFRFEDTRRSVLGPMVNETRTYQVAGSAGIPAAGTADAPTAVVLNVTAIHAATTTGGYFTIYPADVATRPTVSDVNFTGNQTVPNLVVVKLAPDGAFSLAAATPDAAHAVIDVLGYYTRA